jgi:hypothetical protein
MGGYGSGQWYRWGTKETTEGLKALDVRYLQRRGFLQAGSSFSLYWTCRGERCGTIRGVTWPEAVVLYYRTRCLGEEEWHDVEERVPLEWTPCHLGGRRPWFRCPGRGCGRRVALLYAAGRYFLCRRCYSLTYESCNERPSRRALRRAQNLRERLGGSGSMIEPFPRKPKGMHWKTYFRLWEQGQQTDLASWMTLKADFNRMDARAKRVIERWNRRGRAE